jgi:hypothetical protein
MRSVLRILIAGAFVTLLALSWTPAATAFENESFGITPFPERASGSDRASFSIPLETGATFEDAVRIYNLTDEPLRLAVYATDAQAALDDTISVGLREEHPEGVGKWIDLSLRSLELQPRDATTVTFRVKVRSSDPEPELGAIVVENTDRGLAANAAQRLHVLVRTVPPNTQTSSQRVRTFLVQSPWVLIALLGLVVTGAVVWIGARRARRPRDRVVQPGALDPIDEAHVPEAARPVIRRLRAPVSEAHAKTSVLDRVRASAGAARRRDERPLLDDALLVEVDENEAFFEPADDPGDEPAAEPVRREPVSRPKPAPTGATAKRKPIPAPARAAPREPKAPVRTKPVAQRSTGAKRTAAKAKPGPRDNKTARSKGKAKPKPKAKAKPATDKNFIPLKDL